MPLAYQSCANSHGFETIASMVDIATRLIGRHTTSSSCCRFIEVVIFFKKKRKYSCIYFETVNLISTMVLKCWLLLLCRPGTDRVTCLIPLKKALASLPDIERGLCRVYHRSATPTAFVTLMHALEKVLDALPSGTCVFYSE